MGSEEDILGIEKGRRAKGCITERKGRDDGLNMRR